MPLGPGIPYITQKVVINSAKAKEVITLGGLGGLIVGRIVGPGSRVGTSGDGCYNGKCIYSTYISVREAHFHTVTKIPTVNVNTVITY